MLKRNRHGIRFPTRRKFATVAPLFPIVDAQSTGRTVVPLPFAIEPLPLRQALPMASATIGTFR